MVVAEFGKGNVLITPSVDGDFEKGCLILQNGKGTGVVGGEKSTKNFSASEEDIVLTFENTASVDVAIFSKSKRFRVFFNSNHNLVSELYSGQHIFGFFA